MMHFEQHTIKKEEITQLPLEEFSGRIIVIDNEKDVEKAISYHEYCH